ncbi:MAG: TonB-dependent receptor [Rhodanobacter sp.]|nr:MAG: TonB-dependent receptor [Rhodanobacter sp.]
MIKSKIAVAVVAALAFSYGSAWAQPAPQSDTSAQSGSQKPSKTKVKKLQAIMVTGSLIPLTEIETASPVTTITAADIKARGFTTVAQALQATSFATGSVQGQQSSASFTQGAETVSLFGLNPGYTKYLINGRPMGDFPALYNGSDAFNNIAGLPAGLVDHIDILPGGQSSLYGSDAIAGVINIVLKDHIDAPTLSARYGWFSEGGGASRRISGADSWQWGKLNVLAGVQVDSVEPIWGFDRALTAQRNPHGRTTTYPSYDIVEYSVLNSNLYLQDPSQCANASSLFRGTEKLASRPGRGDYCGSLYQPGYKTVTNRKRTVNAYARATYDWSSNLQLYGDLLYKYADTRYTAGSNYTWWGTSVNYGAFWDPNVNGGQGDLVEFQKVFAPEEVGQFSHIESKQFDNALSFTVGGNGTFGNSDWNYDLGLTHGEEHLTNRNFVRFNTPIEAYFANILGPQLGVDPNYNYYPVFSPDYTKMFSPISPQDFSSFTGYATTRSKTWNNMLRAQLTDASLFNLPGGDAGIAVVAEGGNSGWDYSPDPRLLNGGIWGQTDVQGAGHRSRYALTSELRLPVLSQLTFDLSARHDGYKVAGNSLGKTTYMAGVEYRPTKTVLFRGRYGTAFKVPTLPDEFQGLSGYYTRVVDYYNCAQLGYDPSQVGNCPARYSNHQTFGQQSGNTKLQPINAKVWSYGVVWAPTGNLNFTVDYFHTSIDNEVRQQSPNGLTLTEYACRTGIIDINSPTCTIALSQITRNASGNISYIFTPKVNVSNELTNNLIASASWRKDIGSWGLLILQGSYADSIKHTQQAYPSDPNINLLTSPFFSTDFKTKANATVTWIKGDWSSTVYVNRYGKSPNYLSTVYNGYARSGTGSLPPWFQYNASVRYQATPALEVSFMVNNVFNKMPPFDPTYSGTTGTPYNVNNYNVFGRSFYIEATYKFDKKG